MRKSLVAIAALALLVPMILVDSPQASAVKPIATYAYAFTFDETDPHYEVLNDKVIKMTGVSVQSWGYDPATGETRGDWIGTMVFVNTLMIRTGTPTSMVTLHGIGTFTGTVLGKEGTVTFKAVSLWNTDCIIDEGAIIGATGELAGMHGHFGFHEGWTAWPGYDIIWVNFE